MQEILATTIKQHAVQKLPLRIVGGNTKSHFAASHLCSLHTPGANTATILSTDTLNGVIKYLPTELFITAKSGTPMLLIQQVLAEKKQYLAPMPPLYGAASTVGGVVSAGISPAILAGQGLRHFVLGVEMLDGQGRLLRFGGSVIKNVAGYDAARLMCGSWGRLGLITQVSLRVTPQPMASLTLCWHYEAEEILWKKIQSWLQQSLCIHAVAAHANVATILLAGSLVAVERATNLMNQTIGIKNIQHVDNADIFWAAVHTQSLPWFAGCRELWRWQLHPGKIFPSLPVAVESWKEGEGNVVWLKLDNLIPTSKPTAGSNTADDKPLTALLTSLQETGTLIPWRSQHKMPSQNNRRQLLEQAIKSAFDPHHIFV